MTKITGLYWPHHCDMFEQLVRELKGKRPGSITLKLRSQSGDVIQAPSTDVTQALTRLKEQITEKNCAHEMFSAEMIIEWRLE